MDCKCQTSGSRLIAFSSARAPVDQQGPAAFRIFAQAVKVSSASESRVRCCTYCAEGGPVALGADIARSTFGHPSW
ncbi:hypothetical protein HYQ46_003989 [Verticillium longisporum]|nr:hypothetical protein HYQ46_003989 [Verticillium longisporum]